MDILETSPSEVVKNLEAVLPRLIVLLESDYFNSYFLQIIKTLLKDVPAELEINVIEERLLNQVLPCISKIFAQSLTNICHSLESVDDTEDEEIAVTLSQYLQVCLDILSGYNDILEHISKQEHEIKLEYCQSLHRTLPNVLFQAFTHCKDSESNYGPYFAVCTDILTAFFRKGYEVHLKYIKALEDELIFSCSFEEDATLLCEVMDTMVAIIEIVTGLDLKTAAEQWKSYIKISSKYAGQIRDRLDLVRPLSSLLSNIQQIITSVKETMDDKSRTRHLKLGSFVLKVFIKICELYKGYLDEVLTQVLDMLLLLYSCSKNIHNDVLINQELETYICIGGAALSNLFVEDEHFLRDLHKLYNRRMKLSNDNQVGMLVLILVTMKKLVVLQCKTIQDICVKYPLIEMVLTLYNDVTPYIDMNCQLESKDLYTNIISILTSFILSSVSVTYYVHIERLLFQHFFTGYIHTSILVSDILCLIARFTTDNVCLEMVQYLCDILLYWPENLSVDRPEYVLTGVTLIRLSRLLNEKSSAHIAEKYGRCYGSGLSYFLAKGFSRKTTALMVTLPDTNVLKEHYNTYINKLKISSLKKYVEEYEEAEKMFTTLMANLSIVSRGTSDMDNIWNQLLHCHFLRILSSLLPALTNIQILQFLYGVKDSIKHGDTSLKIASARYLHSSVKHKFKSDSNIKELTAKTADTYIELLKDKDPLVHQYSMESFAKFISNGDGEDIIISVLYNDEDIQKLFTSFQQNKLIIQPKQKYFILQNKQRYLHKCVIKMATVDDLLTYPPKKKLKQHTEYNTVRDCLRNLFKEVRVLKDYLRTHEFVVSDKLVLEEITKEIDRIKSTLAEIM